MPSPVVTPGKWLLLDWVLQADSSDQLAVAAILPVSRWSERSEVVGKDSTVLVLHLTGSAFNLTWESKARGCEALSAMLTRRTLVCHPTNVLQKP